MLKNYKLKQTNKKKNQTRQNRLIYIEKQPHVPWLPIGESDQPITNSRYQFTCEKLASSSRNTKNPNQISFLYIIFFEMIIETNL